MAERHTTLGGKVYIYRRPDSSRWQCSSYFAGKNHRISTKEESLAKAKEIGEDWLRGKLDSGEIKAEKTFREVSEQFLREYEIITRGERSQEHLKGQISRTRVHLMPFFGNMGISKITTGKILEYRVHRHQQAIAKRGKPPARSTMHKEIVTAASDPQDCDAPRMARPASRFLGAVPAIVENQVPGMVLTRRIRGSL